MRSSRGYNPIIWKSDGGYGITKDSFIFSFKNKDNTENYILSRVMDETGAIDNDPECGPTFGNCELVLYGKNFYDRSCCYKNNSYYEKQIRETEDEFSVEEYEIFQITKD